VALTPSAAEHGLSLRHHHGMPIIHVDMLEGRSVDQKRALAQGLTDAFVQACGGDSAGVRVVIADVPRTNWAIGGALISDR
jgi:4-oxalocrotonate tautomerase